MCRSTRRETGNSSSPENAPYPPGATHVWAHCVSHDFQHFKNVCAEIPACFLPDPGEADTVQRFSVLTDLHLASKPWMIKRALRAAESDTILLLGDSVNDGLPEQFDSFLACIIKATPDKTILPVPGNHDVTHPRFIGRDADGVQAYASFQQTLLTKVAEKGTIFTYDPDSLAWFFRRGGLNKVGLQCVVSGRKFLSPNCTQLDWLEQHLEANSDADRHIILCHVPLLKHNPNRNTGNPYMGKNRRLQELLDRTGNIVFLSGHTHVSPNVLQGGGELDEKTGNLYLDCGSVVATDFGRETGLIAPDWKDGCIVELTVTKSGIDICIRSIESGTTFPRGYYRFQNGRTMR